MGKDKQNKEKGQKQVQNAQKLGIKERRAKVAAYYEGGADYRQIADFLTESGTPCSKSTVANDIHAIYAELDAKSVEYLEQRRTRQDRRYDTLIRANWKKANEGDWKAGKLVNELMKAQNDLLGLNAAAKFQHQNPDGSAITQPIADAMNSFAKGLDKIYGDGANSSKSSTE